MVDINEALNQLDGINLAHLPEGRHPDGGGLVLRVRGKSRSWKYRYRRNGSQEITLGEWPLMTLARAREYRDVLFSDVDSTGEPVDPRMVVAETQGRSQRARDAAPIEPKGQWVASVLLPDGRVLKLNARFMRRIEADHAGQVRCEWSKTRAADPLMRFAAVIGPKGYWSNVLVRRVEGPELTGFDLM
jgi:hypothetical protein